MIGPKIVLTSIVLLCFFALFVRAAKREPVSPAGLIQFFLLCWFISLLTTVWGFITWIWEV